MKKYLFLFGVFAFFVFLAFLQIIAKEEGMLEYSKILGILKMIPLGIFLFSIFKK